MADDAIRWMLLLNSIYLDHFILRNLRVLCFQIFSRTALHVSIVMIRYFISVVVPAKASCKRSK